MAQQQLLDGCQAEHCGPGRLLSGRREAFLEPNVHSCPWDRSPGCGVESQGLYKLRAGAPHPLGSHAAPETGPEPAEWIMAPRLLVGAPQWCARGSAAGGSGAAGGGGGGCWRRWKEGGDELVGLWGLRGKRAPVP